MDIQTFIGELKHDLYQPLPGTEAQYRMAPRPRSGRLPYDQSPTDARHSGVLILFYPYVDAVGQDAICLPLILRPTYDGVHSGQIAFPGGSWEEGDADLTATALREAEEEIGIERNRVEVIGQLTPLYIYVSNHLVHPSIAWVDHRPEFVPDAREVALILEQPIGDLLDPANRRTEEWQLRDRSAQVPFFHVQQQNIWGATAMMLSELLTLPTVAKIAAAT